MSLRDFSRKDLENSYEQLGEDGKDGKTYLVTLKKVYSAKQYNLKKNTKIAIKTFKPKKSVAKIKKEIEFQNKAAEAGVSIPVYDANMTEKYIAMPVLHSLPAKVYHQLPEEIEYQLCALMARLDDINVLHGDMNALNVMTDTNERVYMIDFGFAKTITKKIRSKHGKQPNVAVSLWGLSRGFQRHKVKCPIINACINAYKQGEDISAYIENGELYLNKQCKTKKRKR
tara:strand:- start:15037 stop:15720 length:684 start_codon:yes stop_codon:yes gene_type:complete